MKSPFESIELAKEPLLHTQEVTDSNSVAPTTSQQLTKRKKRIRHAVPPVNAEKPCRSGRCLVGEAQEVAFAIPLGRGMSALVSQEDYVFLRWYNWRAKWNHCGGFWYAVAHKPGSGKRGKEMRMHRVIMDAQPGQTVDHISGDTLDNRRTNLRN